VFSDQLTDKDEIVVDDAAVSVAQRFLHAGERSGSGFRTYTPRAQIISPAIACEVNESAIQADSPEGQLASAADVPRCAPRYPWPYWLPPASTLSFVRSISVSWQQEKQIRATWSRACASCRRS